MFRMFIWPSRTYKQLKEGFYDFPGFPGKNLAFREIPGIPGFQNLAKSWLNVNRFHLKNLLKTKKSPRLQIGIQLLHFPSKKALFCFLKLLLNT